MKAGTALCREEREMFSAAYKAAMSSRRLALRVCRSVQSQEATSLIGPRKRPRWMLGRGGEGEERGPGSRLRHQGLVRVESERRRRCAWSCKGCASRRVGEF